jgi:hypothetical protein
MVWDGFWTRNASLQHQAALNVIADIVREGGDLTPYLSSSVHTHGFTSSAARRGIAWQDSQGHKDLALNSYDVHHLHLKPCKAGGKRSGGSQPLLYVGVSRDELLLLMLGDHNSFNDGSLHAAVCEHRAQSGFDIKGIAGFSQPISDKEAVKMSRYGIAAGSQTGNKFVVAGLMSSAGTAYVHQRRADEIYELAEDWEPKLDDPALRQGIAETYSIQLSKQGKLKWYFNHADFGIHDCETRKSYTLLPWRR